MQTAGYKVKLAIQVEPYTNSFSCVLGGGGEEENEPGNKHIQQSDCITGFLGLVMRENGVAVRFPGNVFKPLFHCFLICCLVIYTWTPW